MRDYQWLCDDGVGRYISQLSNAELTDILAIGATGIMPADDHDGISTKEDFLERVRIEVLIRELRL